MIEMPIRVLVVDDSATVRRLISEALAKDKDLNIVGTAKDGIEAVSLASHLRPDLITMDLNMPRMNGITATEQIMAYYPARILVFSGLLASDVDLAFQAISAGAVDIMEKPANIRDSKVAEALIGKVKLISKVSVRTHLRGRVQADTAHSQLILSSHATDTKGNARIVAIGASTGGPKALRKILSVIPANFPVGIVIVQHISSGFSTGLAHWLNKESQITVKVAEQGDTVEAGLALIAPHGFHILIQQGGKVRLNKGLPVEGNRPSASVLLSSVAKVYGKKAIGVILTGMGIDGATGLAEVKAAGGQTIVQDEQSSDIFGMPKAAIELGAAEKVLPIEKIGSHLRGMIY